MRGRKIYIRYFALKNEAGIYLGCLEVTQDITKIQKIEGQSRLLDQWAVWRKADPCLFETKQKKKNQ